MYLKTGDVVQVMTGDDKGSRGKILRVIRKEGRVVVEGVNRVYKHVKRGHPKAPQGGRLSMEAPIQSSNVMLIDPVSNKPTRVRRVPGDKAKGEKKTLVAKKSGTVLRTIG